MKIGFVFDDSLDKSDGIQQYIFSLANWLTAAGHEVHYLVGETHRTDLPNVHVLSRNINVNFNGNHLSIPLFGSHRRIRQVFTQERFDVLHVQLPYHPYMAGWVMRLAPATTRIVGTFHILPYGRLAELGARVQWVLSRPSQRRLQSVVSVSPAAQDFAKRIYRLESSVLPNVFDYRRFAEAESLPQFDDDILTILFLGRLVPRKGCKTLLEALVALRQKNESLPVFRVVICGGGSMADELQRYVQQNNLSDIVQFEGRVSEADKPRYYASADISVFPSTGGESFGIVLLEAMASGQAAVIGGDNPGYRSVLGDASAGLVAPGDSAALAQVLHRLLTDESERRQLASWAAASAPAYGVEAIGPKIIDLYEAVAPNSSKGP